TEREQGEWYFQRYIANLPTASETVLFDRSWYNRAGIEHVLGFCTPQQYQRFLRQCPIFERLLVEDGIILIKYLFSVWDKEQGPRQSDDGYVRPPKDLYTYVPDHAAALLR